MATKRINLSFSMNREDDAKVYSILSAQKYKTDYSFASNLSDNDLLKEYQNADIINFPSCHEGFGMPIIEGQAVGRIVVTSNIEPMISVANNGAAICDPYNIESIRNTYIRVIIKRGA